MIVGRNLIAGQWREGMSEIEGRDPSDLSGLVDVFSQSSVAVEFYTQMKPSCVYAGPAT